MNHEEAKKIILSNPEVKKEYEQVDPEFEREKEAIRARSMNHEELERGIEGVIQDHCIEFPYSAKARIIWFAESYARSQCEKMADEIKKIEFWNEEENEEFPFKELDAIDKDGENVPAGDLVDEIFKKYTN